MRALRCRDLPVALRVVLLRVLREVWLDTQRPPTGLIGHEGLLDVIGGECALLGRMLESCAGDDPAVQLVRT